MQNDRRTNTSPLTLPLGVMLNNRYEILSVIGIGGFGITYKGYDLFNESLCAIKELFVNNFVYRDSDGRTVRALSGKERVFDHSIARFMDESGTLKQLNGTPHVVKITDYFKENGTAYFTMDYIDGPTLKGRMNDIGGSFDFDEAVYITTTIGKYLNFIHERHHIFHRDISPENIMLNSDGKPMLIDFGNAKNYMRSSEEGWSIILKPGFAPPEQYTGKDQGPWTDVYSLAGVFYYMVSGTKVPPSTERLIGKGYTPLANFVSECSNKISNAVDRALTLNPNERTQTIREFLEAFEEIKTSESYSQRGHQVSGIPSVKLPYIVIFEYGHKSGKWRIPSDSQIIIGRDGSYSNLIVGEYDTTISKQHCIISFDNSTETFSVTDISTNGVYWRGERLEFQKKLNAGEKITFGNGKYIIEMGVEI